MRPLTAAARAPPYCRGASQSDCANAFCPFRRPVPPPTATEPHFPSAPAAAPAGRQPAANQRPAPPPPLRPREPMGARGGADGRPLSEAGGGLGVRGAEPSPGSPLRSPPAPATLAPGDPPEMPVRSERCRAGGAAAAAASSLVPPPPINTAQPGVATSLLYSGAKFRGQQRSKGNAYEVEVVMQHVDMENSYLCGYLKIKGLTEEYPTLTTFFEGEIISKKHPFLTRKWDADEDVDRKHWVNNPGGEQMWVQFRRTCSLFEGLSQNGVEMEKVPLAQAGQLVPVSWPPQPSAQGWVCLCSGSSSSLPSHLDLCCCLPDFDVYYVSVNNFLWKYRSFSSQAGYGCGCLPVNPLCSPVLILGYVFSTAPREEPLW
uniref:Uncharacterized protein n=1 Tax=Melopsittacus undulatus TaxID=13146 RepID=A0A8V5H9D2_MELUD